MLTANINFPFRLFSTDWTRPFIPKGHNNNNRQRPKFVNQISLLLNSTGVHWTIECNSFHIRHTYSLSVFPFRISRELWQLIIDKKKKTRENMKKRCTWQMSFDSRNQKWKQFLHDGGYLAHIEHSYFDHRTYNTLICKRRNNKKEWKCGKINETTFQNVTVSTFL